MQNVFARICGGAHVQLRHITVMVVTCILFAVYNAGAFAEDEDYLKELEAEAEKSANVSTSKPNKSNRSGNNPRSNSTNRASGNSANNQRERFEQLLQFELPSTYKFYNKLNSEKKAVVFEAYKRTEKLSTASKIIFDLYFEQK